MSKDAPSSEGDSIPWAVILTTLTLSVISAWLVFMHDWNVGEAMLAVSLVPFGILSLLLGVIWLRADTKGRDELWQGFKHTFHDDHDRILKYLHIRRRK